MKIISGKKIVCEEFETDEGTYRRYSEVKWYAVVKISGKYHLFRLNDENTKRLEKLYQEYKNENRNSKKS